MLFAKELISPALKNIEQIKTRDLLNNLIVKKDLELREYSCPISNTFNNQIITNYDRYGLPIEYSVNRESGLIYSSKNLTQESFYKFYKYYYRRLYHGNVSKSIYFPKELTRGRRLKKLIKKNNINLDLNDFVLEIGCGSGGILKELAHKKSLGIDLDKNLVQYGKSNGVNLIYADLNQIEKFIKKKPKLVICSHVIEHIIDTTEFFKKIKIIMDNDTYLYIEVPDPFEKLESFQSEYIEELHIAHFALFTKATLLCLMRKNNFECVDVETSENNISSLFNLKKQERRSSAKLMHENENPITFKDTIFNLERINQKVKKKYYFYNIKILIKYIFLIIKYKICSKKY